MTDEAWRKLPKSRRIRRNFISDSPNDGGMGMMCCPIHVGEREVRAGNVDIQDK